MNQTICNSKSIWKIEKKVYDVYSRMYYSMFSSEKFFILRIWIDYFTLLLQGFIVLRTRINYSTVFYSVVRGVSFGFWSRNPDLETRNPPFPWTLESTVGYHKTKKNRMYAWTSYRVWKGAQIVCQIRTCSLETEL
jgi:hypothetical protein